MFLAKQELKSVPFHILHEKAILASNAVEENLVSLEKLHRDNLLKKAIAEWNATHDKPFSGNWDEIFPEPKVDQGVLAEAKLKARTEAVKDAIDTLGLKGKASWLLPQFTAYVAKFKPCGYDGAEYIRTNLGSDDWHKGLYLYGTVPQRGVIVPSQGSKEFLSYSALVPLFLMPHKKMNSTKYSQWSNIRIAVDPQLYLTMVCEKPFLGIEHKEELLQVREQGLVVKSGTNAGQRRNPASYHKLYGVKDTLIGELPWLAQVMATQIWAAHPNNRSELMILNWSNWDEVPEPLISTEVEVTKARNIVNTDLPWDM